MEPQDLKHAEGIAKRRWNSVRYERLSREQADALQLCRTVYDGNVRWSAVELQGRKVELTIWCVDGEAARAMREDPESIYARRIVIDEAGQVRGKEMVSL